MIFTIITHATHVKLDKDLLAYAPYVKEMNLWIKNADKLLIVAPLVSNENSPIFKNYIHKNISLLDIPLISITSFLETIRSIVFIPIILLKIFKAMYLADHIHLRCPGNIGLLGCFVQVLFPKKIKTAKYAGNWDPKAKQPISYKLQKWILSNTFLTRNMTVLVYGEWPNQSKNIKPFFTASYAKAATQKSPAKKFKAPFKFLFVGSLVSGKRPLYAIKLIESLVKKGEKCTLTLYGDGVDRTSLENYVQEKNLTNYIVFKGNKTAAEVQQAYKKSDFLMLPSKSEGWPKVVAEAMFWGLIPIVTEISCVPWMLDYGTRGILITLDEKEDLNKIVEHLNNPLQLEEMSQKAQLWSQQYTLDTFDAEILKLL